MTAALSYPLCMSRSNRACDPRLRCIRRYRHGWKVLIAGGRQGKKFYVGIYRTLHEAIDARDAAEKSAGRRMAGTRTIGP